MGHETLYSEDPEIIAGWAREAHAAGLYRPDGCAQYSLAGIGSIYRMAYTPGIAWLMYCDLVYPPSWDDRIQPPRWQAFVRPDMRKQGHYRRLCDLYWQPIPPAT